MGRFLEDARRAEETMQRGRVAPSQREFERDILKMFLVSGIPGIKERLSDVGSSIATLDDKDPIEMHESDAIGFLIVQDVMPWSAAENWAPFERNGFIVGPEIRKENQFRIPMRQFVLPKGWSKVSNQHRTIDIRDSRFEVRATLYLKALQYSGVVQKPDPYEASLVWIGKED